MLSILRPIAATALAVLFLAPAAFASSHTSTLSNAGEYLTRAYSKVDLGDHQGAIADFTLSLALHPGNASAFLGRGISKFELGADKTAIADFTQSIEIQPNYMFAFFWRGFSKAELGMEENNAQLLEEARADFRRYAGLGGRLSGANKRFAAGADW